MSQSNDEENFEETNLESAEYRERLMRKLNCLIALLEVAMARVRKSLAGPEPDVNRLTRIRTNLQSTLEVCVRARTALERREALPKDLPATLADVSKQTTFEGMPKEDDSKVVRARGRNLPFGAQIEMSSREEHRKFERLGKITSQELADVDLEALTRQLQGF
ncbi:MAG: hypothetical protein H6831_12270 [Planctomycetes bacterium]|nr:hypothetical protein [Planctomycetota bacterium]MCB9905176.1 hypothetical protein [Planctomycetota bacterium]